jgi:VWFA-related protein
MRRIAAAFFSVSVAALAAAPQAPARPQPQASARAGVDLVTVDVGVIDSTGAPIDHLTPDDFSLTVNGRRRALTTAEFVDLRRTGDRVDPERAKFSSNQGLAPGRAIQIVIDEGNIHASSGGTVVASAYQFIDALSGTDRVSVEFIPGTGPLTGFTSNHALVKELIANRVDAIAKANITLNHTAQAQAAVTLLSLRSIIERLASHVNAPTTLALITEGLAIDTDADDLAWVAPLTSAAHVNLYVLQLDDQHVIGDGLNRLAGQARGAVLPVAATAASAFARLDRELSGYYLLSFEPDPADRDGQPHTVSVTVTRPGATVRARPQFTVAPAAPAMTAQAHLVQVLKSPLPIADVGLKLTTFTFRDDDTKKLKVLITTEIDRSFNPAGDFLLGCLVTDSRGTLVGSQLERALALPTADDVGRPQRYTGAFVLDPGRYNVKVAVIDPDGRAGSVERAFSAALVPAGPLRLGELMLAEVVGQTAKPSVDGRINADSLMAYAEVYSDSGSALKNTTIGVEIGRTENDTPIERAPLKFSDRSFEGKRAAEGRIPIEMLPAGDYIARAVSTVNGKVVGQVTRPFTVTHAASSVTTPEPAPGSAPATRSAGPNATGERISFTSAIDDFDVASVLTPRVVSFFVDRMNIVGQPQLPAELTPSIQAARSGRFVELRQLLATAPAHPATTFLTGIAKMSVGDLPAAEASLRETLKTSPEFFPAAFYLGAAYAETGRDADAVAIWQTALITDASAPFVYTLLGDAMLRLHRTADAIGLLREAAALWPDAGEVAMRFGTALAQGGQAANALKVLDPYLQTHATDVDRLMLAMRLVYEARSANRPIDTVENDRARFHRYFAAYEQTGGPQLELARQWKAIIDR